MSKPDKLVSKILKARYFPNYSFVERYVGQSYEGSMVKGA
jgi:hypothetical protein